jgi:hypothetical protein
MTATAKPISPSGARRTELFTSSEAQDDGLSAVNRGWISDTTVIGYDAH